MPNLKSEEYHGSLISSDIYHFLHKVFTKHKQTVESMMTSKVFVAVILLNGGDEVLFTSHDFELEEVTTCNDIISLFSLQPNMS